jgi:hypothetical protein
MNWEPLIKLKESFCEQAELDSDQARVITLMIEMAYTHGKQEGLERALEKSRELNKYEIS